MSKVIIPGLTSEIMAALYNESIIERDADYHPYYDSAWVNSLIALGFKRVGNGNTNNILINKKQKLIVKHAYFTDRHGGNRETPPTDCVPTLFVKKINHSHFVVVQPLVNTRLNAVAKADSIIHSLPIEERLKRFGDDTHQGNIGYYKRKPVVFDY